MSNVLIRDVPIDDLEQIRAAAAAQGTSLQSYQQRADDLGGRAEK